MVRNNCYKVISVVTCKGNWKYLLFKWIPFIIFSKCLSFPKQVRSASLISWGEPIQVKFQANTSTNKNLFVSNCHLGIFYKDMRVVSFFHLCLYCLLMDSFMFDVKIGNGRIRRRQYLMDTLHPFILFLLSPSLSVWQSLGKNSLLRGIQKNS